MAKGGNEWSPATSPHSQSTDSIPAARSEHMGHLPMESTSPDQNERQAAAKGANLLLAGTGEGIIAREPGDLDLGWKPLAVVPCSPWGCRRL